MQQILSGTGARLALASVAILLQSGCQSMPSGNSAYAGYPGGYGYNQISPAAGPAPAGAVPYGALPAPAAAAPVEFSSGNLSAELRDRLDRLEKAMLRLDRRMQLVEGRELQRMSGADPRPQMSLPSAGSAEEQAAMKSLDIGPASTGSGGGGYQNGFRPVAESTVEPINDGVIRSSLQAAPRDQLASAQLPSLADAAAGRSAQPASNVAVWTIRYMDEEKVWPERAQLPSGREVIDALRSNSAGVTLFARGPNPNSKVFRERVKAISRYLAKVASLDTVPIAAMPSPQMDPGTIEILATH